MKKDTDSTPADDLDLKPQMPKKLIERFENLPSDWKQKLYDLALEGESDTGLYTSLALTRRKHETLLKVEEYSEWFDYCHDVSLNWWFNFAKIVCRRKDYNGATFNLVMQNRAGWGQQPKTADKPPDETPSPEPTKNLEDFKPAVPTPEAKPETANH
jgi:hypothetical protein